ncbi:MAG: hypothetical protein ACTSU2_04870 [Promethearchaeota archaeon]
MSKKIRNIGNFLKRSWFSLSIIIVLLIYFLVDYKLAVLILLIEIIILAIEIVVDRTSARRFIKFLERFRKISDIEIARRKRKDLDTVRKKLNKLQGSNKLRGLLLYFDGKYYYYNQKTTEILKHILVDQGVSTPEALRLLGKYGFDKRREIDNLRRNLSRLSKAEGSRPS